MKCPYCGHAAEMHWYPEEPGLPNFGGHEIFHTTACRDCLPRHLYPHYPAEKFHGGMCTMTRDAIETWWIS